MKAIVFTCDKYMAFANHTIMSYERHWPSNQFTYRVPYNTTYPQFMADHYGKKLELVKTDSPIRATVLQILADLDEQEWIYWCMDDRYILRARDKELQALYEFVLTITDPLIYSVLAIATQPYFHHEKFIKKDSFFDVKEDLRIYETVFTEEERLMEMYRPQFVRVKQLRRLFESFPDRDFVAVEMNGFPHQKLKGEKAYVPEKNLLLVGESTHRGELTENSLMSFKQLGLDIPENFKVTRKYMLQGELPHRLFGYEFNLPPKIQRFITRVNRWYWRNK